MATITMHATVRESRRASTPQRRTRLTGRGRVAILMLVGLVAVLALSFSHSVAFGGSDHSGGAATSSVIVQPGQTLWQIAQTVAPQADPRETIARIRELNGLSGTQLVPGQQLIVPRFA